jgi:hypothetical protein
MNPLSLRSSEYREEGGGNDAAFVAVAFVGASGLVVTRRGRMRDVDGGLVVVN